MKWRFEKQMAHQCSVKYKDLTLYAILFYHEQVSNAQSDLIEKCLHSIVLLCLIWRNLYQIRSIRGQHFLFSFEENYCEIIPITWRSLWNMFQKTCERWFQRFKIGDFDVADKEHGKPPKNTKTWNCKHCWMKMIHKHKNNSQSNWGLVNKLFPIAYEKWERFRKSVDGVPHELNERQMERRKNTNVKFCSNDTEESHSCIVSLLGMKSGFFFENPKRKKSWVDSGAPSTSTTRIADRKAMLCVWWDQKDVGVYYELLKPGETVNTKRYQQQLIDLNRSLLKKRSEYQKRQHKVIFLYDNAPSHTAKPIRHVGSTQLGSSIPCGLLTRLGSFRLPLVCIDGSRTCWTALWFVRRCEKMARWMVRGKRGRFLLAWYPQIARKMGKMCN